MNYGYSDGRLDRDLALPSADAAERYSAQLYHAVASQAPLQGRRLLDVGSGRGGGAAHMHTCFAPAVTVGCDIAAQAVRFCRKVHGGIDGLSFVRADAATLPFPAASFDVVTNVESAHCYPDRAAFFAEVRRVLAPGGSLLFADFTPPRRHPAEARADLAADLAGAGFGGVEIADITDAILRGLDADDARRRREIDRRFPFGLRTFARLWAGTKGSWIYRDFAEGRRAYLMVSAHLPSAGAAGRPAARPAPDESAAHALA